MRKYGVGTPRRGKRVDTSNISKSRVVWVEFAVSGPQCSVIVSVSIGKHENVSTIMEGKSKNTQTNVNIYIYNKKGLTFSSTERNESDNVSKCESKVLQVYPYCMNGGY